MRAASHLPGFFGKLPALGDFVSRRLDSDFINSWDAWLSEGISASREQLGANWLKAYLTSPIWRFLLSPGNCGSCSWAGIMMPSVDSVGRYFPLTLAVPVYRRELLPCLFSVAAEWFEELELSALSALDDEFNIEAFDKKLKALNIPLPPVADQKLDVGQKVQKYVNNGTVTIVIEMRGLEQLPEVPGGSGDGLFERLLSVYSLWSTNGSPLVKPTFLAYNCMPPPTAYVQLLTGCWRDAI